MEKLLSIEYSPGQYPGINTTDMFRDPEIFAFIRKEVTPYLETFARPSVWHAACSTGQEVYSMAILLQEAGLLPLVRLLGTDYSPENIEVCRKGEYQQYLLEGYQRNFQGTGVKRKFREFITKLPGRFQLTDDLRHHVKFTQHNLLLDNSPGQFSCIFCRNVMIYYSVAERQKMLELITESLQPMGFLCLGKVEDLRFSPIGNKYRQWKKGLPVYQKISN